MSISQQGPGIFMPDGDAHFLYHRLGLGDVRKRMRGKDDRLYGILLEIAKAAYRVPAASGNDPRQFAARDDAEFMTVSQVARAAGVSLRTVRLDAQNMVLPAIKSGQQWIITTADADAYIAARRTNGRPHE